MKKLSQLTLIIAVILSFKIVSVLPALAQTSCTPPETTMITTI